MAKAMKAKAILTYLQFLGSEGSRGILECGKQLSPFLSDFPPPQIVAQRPFCPFYDAYIVLIIISHAVPLPFDRQNRRE